MKIKNKILFILIFVLFLLFLLNSDCFATFDVDFDGSTYSFSDLPSDIGINQLLGFGGRSVSRDDVYLFCFYDDTDLSQVYYGINKDNFNEPTLFSKGIIHRSIYKYYISDESWQLINHFNNGYSGISIGIRKGISFSTFDLLNEDGSVYMSKNSLPLNKVNYPYITNSNAIFEYGNFDYVCINSGDFIGGKWQDFYLLAYDYSQEDEEQGIITAYPRKEILITEDSIYYNDDYDGSHVYMIPFRCNRN